VAKLNAFTVPDVLWLNLQLTRQPQAFDYALLEEATFYQYGLGQNHDIAAQAARFLNGFKRLRPFASGNDATGFAACIGFLEANGHGLKLSDQDALQWVRSLWDEGPGTGQAVEAALLRSETPEAYGVPNTEEILAGVITRYPETIAALLDAERAAA
jgi:prophage maintenance system killer protein